MLPAILNRRSVRFYRDTPVGEEQIEEVLKAGFCAPNAHAAFPWHVVVVRDQAKREALSGIHRWSRILSRVPVVLAVCVDKTKSEHFWIEDGAAFLDHMLIQASEMGLGMCWIGIRGLQSEEANAEQMVREVCGLPDHLGVVALSPLGYPARHPGPHEPKLPDGRVHYDTYSRGEE